VGGWFSSHVHGMKAKQSSPKAIQKTAQAQKSTAPAGLIQNKSVSAPSQEAVARRAYAIYEKQGSQPGHEVKHWLEAVAQLFGGIERESQMHLGSSLFKTEH
jgi:hypothetical protein